MNKYLVSINDLPPQGKEFDLDDQEIWLEPLREFKMDCRITTPLRCKIFVMSTDDGCLVRGKLTGAVAVPCNRCAEDANVSLDASFDEYEEIPSSDGHHTTGDGAHEENHIVFDRGAPMLNLAEVAWEQFMLALPASPLCKQDCKGLCPQCGTNLNIGTCACERDEGDPRMAALRGLSISGKKESS